MAITVVNKHKHIKAPDDVYIGRGSVFGNPYTHGASTLALYKVGNRAEAVEKFKEYLYAQPKESPLIRAIEQLKLLSTTQDISLVCFCAPYACHGDVIKEYILNDNNNS